MYWPGWLRGQGCIGCDLCWLFWWVDSAVASLVVCLTGFFHLCFGWLWDMLFDLGFVKKGVRLFGWSFFILILILNSILILLVLILNDILLRRSKAVGWQDFMQLILWLVFRLIIWLIAEPLTSMVGIFLGIWDNLHWIADTLWIVPGLHVIEAILQ